MPDEYGTFGSYLADTLTNSRAFAKQQMQQNALKAYDPNNPSSVSALRGADPDTYVKLATLGVAQAKAAQDAKDAATKATGDNSVMTFLGRRTVPQAPVASPVAASPTSLHAPGNIAPVPAPGNVAPNAPAQAPVSASPQPAVTPVAAPIQPGVTPPQNPQNPAPVGGVPPAPNPDGDIVVQARAPATPTLADLANMPGVSPELMVKAAQIQEHIATAGKAQREALSDQADTWGALGAAMLGDAQHPPIPYDQRRAYIDAHRSILKGHGISDDEINSFDPTDQNIQAEHNLALGTKGSLAESESNRNFAETQRAHADENARAAAARAVTIRGQNMTDARSREANSISSAQADNPALVDYLAQNFIKTGGQMPALGMKSAPLRAAIVARAQQIAAGQGQDGTALADNAAAFVGKKAGARTIGTTGAKVDYGVNEMEAAAPLALAASAAVPRGNFVPYNKAVQMLASGNSDPALKRFVVQTNAFLNAYNVVAGRAGTDVNARAENRALLTNADGPAAYRAGIAAMRQEGAVTKAATGQTMGDITGQGRLTPQQASKLPAGTHFVGVDGVSRVKH